MRPRRRAIKIRWCAQRCSNAPPDLLQGRFRAGLFLVVCIFDVWGWHFSDLARCLSLSPRCTPKRTSARALYDLFKEVARPSARLAEVGIESEARLHKYGPVKGVPF